ncbi:uncharacterized protein LOC125780243 [Bactrocera dorsalis]|uniref:Uncharacterized protein LOC125780243 n=1 Tax=Bactrocera dorsalis TaxID=27457 RepID=A0ABM3K9F8_BACDO|nr:uncharacterized protein LOC125780243 [Bactrocera dorsalis]XP_049318109.1 uncharacterized protein LOC125780243 [Bactrocera dorsalis]XP_049318110.1 uncharacterized protein LOC125780243 [Bactrocera dorsalis]
MTHLQPQRRYYSPMRFKGGGGGSVVVGCVGSSVDDGSATDASISASVSTAGGCSSESAIGNGVEILFNTDACTAAAVALDYCSHHPDTTPRRATTCTRASRRPNHHLSSSSTKRFIPPPIPQCRRRHLRRSRHCWPAFCVQHFLLFAHLLLLFACGDFLQVATAEPYGGSSSSVGIHIPGGSLGVISESRCPRVCSCNGLTVDCSHRGLTQVPRKISADVERLDLQGNNITVIFEADFQRLTKLRILQLTDNQIHTIEKGAFQDLVSLERL